jgi:glutathione S-transferase
MRRFLRVQDARPDVPQCAAMKLYYATATCSLSAHMALREAGLAFDLVRFDMKTRLLEDGRPLDVVNDKGYVPVLELDDGTRLTEVAAILQYVADQVPERALAPALGSFERYRLIEWLSFIGMEVHKIFWPLFHEGAEIENTHARDKLARSFTWIEKHLGDQPFLMGSSFTVADCYLVTVLNWTRAGGIDLERWPALKDYRLRLRARPAVAAALEAEGLKR